MRPSPAIANGLTVLVTTPSAQPEIAARAAGDLAMPVHMTGMDSAALLDRVVSRPDSFDVVQLEYWMVPRAFAAGGVQAVPVSRLRAFDELLPLFTRGTVGGRAVSRQGTAPHSVQFVDGPRASAVHGVARDHLSIAPTICNSDSLGWRPDRVARSIDSWGDLLAPDLRGRVALSGLAPVSIVEAALACEARGLVEYVDKGDMSRAEIDATLRILGEAWRDGHFLATWRTFEESVALMGDGPVVLQSLWPPAVSALRQRGIAVRYGPLREGARGWAGGLALAAHLTGARLDAAIDYLNWYQSGWTGARLSRQGFYAANPAAARRHLTADEWGYWYEGWPATDPIVGPDGRMAEPAGARREGGSFDERMGRIAVWSSRMTEDAYLQARWQALLAEPPGRG